MKKEIFKNTVLKYIMIEYKHEYHEVNSAQINVYVQCNSKITSQYYKERQKVYKKNK